MAIANDVCVETAFDHEDERPLKSFTTDKRPLHRIAEVRRQQGVSVRSAARRMGASMEYIRTSELPNVDMSLSDLYRWQQALDVPIADLLVDLDAPISSPVLARARMLKVMKTVKAIGEATTNPSIGRMVTMLEEQLCEIMPELKDVSAWHSVGQRRTQDEMGRIAERPVSDNFARDAMG
jgi:transcriptional regulator with XRE-family HTH domain